MEFFEGSGAWDNPLAVLHCLEFVFDGFWMRLGSVRKVFFRFRDCLPSVWKTYAVVLVRLGCCLDDWDAVWMSGSSCQHWAIVLQNFS